MAGRFQNNVSASSVPSPPLDFFSLMSLSPGMGSSFPWPRELDSEQRGLSLIKLLRYCASLVAAGNFEHADIGLEHISHLASADGDTMQRIAVYFTEALAHRMLKSWSGFYKALTSTTVSLISEAIHVQRLFYDLFPFLKISHAIMNQAIMEAMEGEKMIHIIDLNAFEFRQWIDLLRALKMRPEGPPHLRITGIHEQKEVLDHIALRLTEEAEKLDIPFQFHPVVSKLEDLNLEILRVKTGEALAISSILQLHSLLATDEEVHRRNSPSSAGNQFPRVFHMNQSQRTLGDWLKRDLIQVFSPSPDSALSPLSLAPSPQMDRFLTALWERSPKLMVIMEQESDHNGFTLTERLNEALNFYAALFDCLDSTASRASIDRHKVEKLLFAKEIKNIIACEGRQRKERHERLDKWIHRLELARFSRVPLSYDGMLQANMLLQSHGLDKYRIKEENGCLVIWWSRTPLFSVSAWRFRGSQLSTI